MEMGLMQLQLFQAFNFFYDGSTKNAKPTVKNYERSSAIPKPVTTIRFHGSGINRHR